ncbi:MAG: di-trans,poly-cis-decaprenylcistransferase [Candidatus Ancillula sp.]|jgi:undecaprenyl diphosphate synthase|nr:di-trans,poly-cis-decaprenylcistransferase [Candidatus Ancillula sp.]
MNELEMPKHVAVVMDGNGRWAIKRGLERTAGHEAGEKALMKWVHEGVKLGIEEMSFYTFSTENWTRSPSEVRFLMDISKKIMRMIGPEFLELGVRVKWVGRRTRLWKSVLSELEKIQNLTKNCDKMTVNFCINYGGRSEILDAITSLLKEVQNGEFSNTKITQKQFKKYMYNSSMRDVDLMIRTSGEQRISNFLLWQLAYAEMIFLDDAWPDTDGQTLQQCIAEYNRRTRRFGAV